MPPVHPSSSSQELAEQQREPNEYKYEYISKTLVVPPKNATYDYAAFDGPGKNNWKRSVELDCVEDEDYVIKIDGGKTTVVKTNYENEPYDTIIQETKVETHYENGVRHELYDKFTRPEAKVETHYDHIAREPEARAMGTQCNEPALYDKLAQV